MKEYRLLIDQVICLLGDNKGRMHMDLVFHKLGRLPDTVDGRELANQLARTYEYLLPYGAEHPNIGNVQKGEWILSEKGWSHYKRLKELDGMDIPY